MGHVSENKLTRIITRRTRKIPMLTVSCFFFSGIKTKASEALHYCANHHILKTFTFSGKEKKQNKTNKNKH